MNAAAAAISLLTEAQGFSCPGPLAKKGEKSQGAWQTLKKKPSVAAWLFKRPYTHFVPPKKHGAAVMCWV